MKFITLYKAIFQSFMRRLHENRLKTFDRGRAELERSRADLLIESSIQDEINALRLSEHVSADELDEAIEEFERFREELVQQGRFFIDLTLFRKLDF